MTALTQAVPVDQLRAQAAEKSRQARPGHALATVIGAFFFALGWIAGGSWRGLVFCGLSLRYGYWRGLGMTDEQIAARPAPSPAAPAASSRALPGRRSGRVIAKQG